MAGKAERARLILASGSQTRRTMLRAAGLAFDVVPASVDEEQLRANFHRVNPWAKPVDLALHLAEAKACGVSRAHPDGMVIGGDQILSLGAELVHKSRDMEEARATLMRLRGKTHELHSGAALATGGACLWKTADTARMTMREFSGPFLSAYLASAGDAVLSSVGVYQLEGLGIQLFERIEGNHFTILGLPLLALLAELRAQEIIPA